MPLDKLFDTFHDGTPEAHARMRALAKARRGITAVGRSCLTPKESGHTAVVTDDAAMEQAIEQARQAAAVGEVPVGAVVLIDGEIVAARHNERETTNDPTAHAEVLALRDAAAAVGDWRLSGATLVVTLEPCPMCAGAALSARVARVVFGAYDPKAGAAATLYNLLVDPRFNHNAEVIGGVREAECGELLSKFFSNHR